MPIVDDESGLTVYTVVLEDPESGELYGFDHPADDERHATDLAREGHEGWTVVEVTLAE